MQKFTMNGDKKKMRKEVKVEKQATDHKTIAVNGLLKQQTCASFIDCTKKWINRSIALVWIFSSVEKKQTRYRTNSFWEATKTLHRHNLEVHKCCSPFNTRETVKYI